VPGPYSGNQRSIWRISFLINLAILVIVLIAGAVIAVNWGNPLPIHLPTLSLGGKIVFGWLVVVVALLLCRPLCYFRFTLLCSLGPSPPLSGCDRSDWEQ